MSISTNTQPEVRLGKNMLIKLLLNKVNCEAADLILEVTELRLAGLIVVGDGIVIDSDALSLKVCYSSVNEVSLDADVAALAGALLVHELELLACEG